MEKLSELYLQWSGNTPTKIEPLAKSGSNRSYYRLYGENPSKLSSIIGVLGDVKEENNAFIYLSRHFSAAGLHVPTVLAVSDDDMSYLQTDLGIRSLYDALAEGRSKSGKYNKDEVALIKATLMELPKLQILGAKGLDSSQCFPQPSFDARNVRFDFNYFKYCFLWPLAVMVNEPKLEDSFIRLGKELVNEPYDTFMYRDFQVRNVMLSDDNTPLFVDYQGGRLGPLEYDVASFLWQASAQFSSALRAELIEYYLDALSAIRSVDRALFKKRLHKYVLLRMLQVLGAYGFRGLFERKTYFIESIPKALNTIKELIAVGTLDNYPYLRETLKRAMHHWNEREGTMIQKPDTGKSQKLHVRIFSFSYRKGIPLDISGNGGGYVFDCRAIHNPGRYDEYKTLSGLDKPVIDFLETEGEISTFLDSIYILANKHIDKYIERGFSNLMFSFGCTGGQHRSVYSAQHLGEYLKTKYDIDISVVHRELGVSTVL